MENQITKHTKKKKCFVQIDEFETRILPRDEEEDEDLWTWCGLNLKEWKISDWTNMIEMSLLLN